MLTQQYFVMTETIPNNKALVITLHEAYSPGFRKHFDANVNIIGSVLNHVRTIKSTLTKGHFIFSQIQ